MSDKWINVWNVVNNINFFNKKLAGLNLNSANLENVTFEDSDLSGVDFSGSNLSNAISVSLNKVTDTIMYEGENISLLTNDSNYLTNVTLANLSNEIVTSLNKITSGLVYKGQDYSALANGTALTKEMLLWDGSQWSSVATSNLFGNLAYLDQVDTNFIADKSVTTSQLADGTSSVKEMLLWDGTSWLTSPTSNLFGNLAYLSEVATRNLTTGTTGETELLIWNGTNWDQSQFVGDVVLTTFPGVGTMSIIANNKITTPKLVSGNNGIKEMLFWDGDSWEITATSNLFGNLAYQNTIATSNIFDGT